MNNILMINSFKGGCGKTSIALGLVVSAANMNHYENIYYIDIDISGSGLAYKIDSNSEDKYLRFRDTNFKDIIRTVKIYDKKTNFLVLDPLTRLDIECQHGNKIKIDITILEHLFADRIAAFIMSTLLSDINGSLFVIDCSPGYRLLEKMIANKLTEIENVDVLNIFVSSFSLSHILKTAEGVSRLIYDDSSRETKTCVVINDIQNVMSMDKSEIFEELIYSENPLFSLVENNIASGILKEKMKGRILSIYNPFNIAVARGDIIKLSSPFANEKTHKPYAVHNVYDFVRKIMGAK